MLWLVFLVWGPVVVGLVLAMLWWLLRRRASGHQAVAGTVVPFGVGLILLLAVVYERMTAVPLILPFEMPAALTGWYADVRFAFPLALGVLGLIALAFPARSGAGRGAADLTRRTPFSFGRRWWFSLPTVLLALILLATILAGFASRPDPTTGRHVMFLVEIGGQHAMGTEIYGWFYSVPCLILLAIMLGLVYLNLVLIARPAMASDHARDVQTRTARTRTILAVATGALSLHLGAVLQSLAGTASMRGQFTADGGAVHSWTPFAALGPVLSGAGFVALTLGVVAWALVVLSAVPSRHPARAMVDR